MRGLFLRIFVSFWLAMLMVMGGSFLVFELSGPPPRWERRRALFDDALRLQGDMGLRTLDAEGRAASDAMLDTLAERTGISMVLLRDGAPVAGRIWGGFDVAYQEVLAATPDESTDGSTFREIHEDGRHLMLIDLPTGSVLTFRHRSSALDRFVGPYIWARLLIVALVAGLLALLLARYLTRPLGRLRSAAQRLAEGDLEVRVAPQVRGATHEVEALGADLDRMAERISELLAAQRRLLQDVSHELRSPLARLHVALGLVRRTPSETQHMDRIELEADRLGDLIGQILTLSRLTGLPQVERLDLGELLSEVVRDADYEAKAKGRSVTLETDGEIDLEGNRDVLRWAVENVLRNAVRFAPEDTAVEVRLERHDDDVLVRIRDHGPGVPEGELEAIFRAFYRVAPDRDRRTGGHGIGLAIAERSLRAHDGTIRASNAAGGGLEVTLSIPASRVHDSVSEPS